jgi:hypothetical protein
VRAEKEGSMTIIDEFPFPTRQPEAQELIRVMAALYSTERTAILFTQPHGVDPLTLVPNLSPINLWCNLLGQLAAQGTVRAVVKTARDRSHNNPVVTAFLDRLLAAPPSPTITAGGYDPYEFIHLFDRIDETDQVVDALTNYAAPPPLKPIVIGILAERHDEYTYFVKRINLDVLRRVYQDAPWTDEFLDWGKTAKAEVEIRRIAKKKLGTDVGRIEDLIARLTGALAGRSLRIEIRSDLLQQPEMRAKLEEFLSLWSQLGVHAPPPVLYVVVVRFSDADLGLAEAQALASPVFEQISDRLITVKPVMLSLCELTHFAGWQAELVEMKKIVDPVAYRRLRDAFAAATFRLGDLMTQLEANRIY